MKDEEIATEARRHGGDTEVREEAREGRTVGDRRFGTCSHGYVMGRGSGSHGFTRMDRDEERGLNGQGR
jgi:hypothetical protein